ncbi:MFS transporter [Pseudomonas alliivorans]|uniref:MFS transporter n=1 Tax=Pseudomonas alliivorans TaxID=2810613 RepID=A0ABS4C113_9PSED|nr:MFS transporter [Pseudomonas alliivorans]MBP0944333.1 MFS transporter [Pseudomonas alliivorans]MEE4325374.1 MFS transporter [Pseudomonas alliivorans]MEE4332425.1 MFS transporter [Pseudomonas alliivorans]MEE4366904.1 MFS transporter [Pseudomonas alliivorans]MEE5069199.1 MFS transporter [Pseudomonas alliivorans]
MTMDKRDGKKLPLGALLALAMTGFICIVTETLPAGLLPEIGSGLAVSPSLAGQMVTVYALGSLLAAIPLTVATQSWRRRTVLLLPILGFLIFNSVTALSSNYWLTLVARFFAGASAGLAWSLIAGYARRMVIPQLQGKAMAIAMVGTPVALSLGVPLGTWLGGFMGWRMAFGLMSGMTLVLIAWVLIKVPDYPGQASSERMALRQVFFTPGVRSVLGVVFTWMLAHNILYTYIAPFIAGSGLANDVDVVLLAFGIAALLGIWGTGRLVDRYLRATVLASLATFAAVSVFFGLFPGSALAIYIGVFIWGLTFGGAATLLQTALADSAAEGADVALSMNVVVWNSAIAGGGIVGGVLLGQWGAGSFPWVLLVLLLGGLVITSRARAHGFTQGVRQSGQWVAGH